MGVWSLELGDDVPSGVVVIGEVEFGVVKLVYSGTTIRERRREEELLPQVDVAVRDYTAHLLNIIQPLTSLSTPGVYITSLYW